MNMLQKIKSGLLIVLSIALLLPAVSAHAVTPKQQALSAYSRWLSGAKIQVMPTGFKDYNGVVHAPVPASQTDFAIAYINNDSIPELIVRTSDKHYFSVLTYKNGKIVRTFYENDMYNTVKGYYAFISVCGVGPSPQRFLFKHMHTLEFTVVYGDLDVLGERLLFIPGCGRSLFRSAFTLYSNLFLLFFLC